MSAITARLDPCVNWMKLLSRTHGRILWAFPVLLIAGYMWSVNWGDAFSGISRQKSVRDAHSPLLSEARRLGLTFNDVLAHPQIAIGRPVTWCVSSKDGQTGFVDEKATMPVVWAYPSEDLRTFLGTHGYCQKELSIIEGLDRGAVLLRPIEKL